MWRRGKSPRRERGTGRSGCDEAFRPRYARSPARTANVLARGRRHRRANPSGSRVRNLQLKRRRCEPTLHPPHDPAFPRPDQSPAARRRGAGGPARRATPGYRRRTGRAPRPRGDADPQGRMLPVSQRTEAQGRAGAHVAGRVAPRQRVRPRRRARPARGKRDRSRDRPGRGPADAAGPPADGRAAPDTPRLDRLRRALGRLRPDRRRAAAGATRSAASGLPPGAGARPFPRRTAARGRPRRRDRDSRHDEE